ncbi:MAG: hypothetical protein SFZ02_12280 [bacterium]|nr:hypothetical protein [bacterium]
MIQTNYQAKGEVVFAVTKKGASYLLHILQPTKVVPDLDTDEFGSRKLAELGGWGKHPDARRITWADMDTEISLRLKIHAEQRMEQSND